MSLIYNILPIDLNNYSTGGNITLPISSSYNYFNFINTVNPSSNINILPDTTPVEGTYLKIGFEQGLDWTMSTLTIFGNVIPNNVANSPFEVELIYINSAWKLKLFVNNESYGGIPVWKYASSVAGRNSISNIQFQPGQLPNERHMGGGHDFFFGQNNESRSSGWNVFIGENNSDFTGSNYVFAFGKNNATGAGKFLAVFGEDSTAGIGDYSYTFGIKAGTPHSAFSYNSFRSNLGDSLNSQVVTLGAYTSDDTPTDLYFSGFTNVVWVDPETIFHYEADVSAYQIDNLITEGSCKIWKVKFGVRYKSTGTPSIIYSLWESNTGGLSNTKTHFFQDGGGSGLWDFDISLAHYSGPTYLLRLTGTGEAGANIMWYATLKGIHCKYTAI